MQRGPEGTALKMTNIFALNLCIFMPIFINALPLLHI